MFWFGLIVGLIIGTVATLLSTEYAKAMNSFPK